MSVLVTGVGHIGSYVARDLIAAGEDVVLYGYFGGSGVAGTSELPDLEFLDYLVGGDLRDKATVVLGDITDLDTVTAASERHGVRSIAHLASLVSATAEARPLDAVRVNVLGTANMFDVGSRLSMDRIVWASTIDVFGPGSIPASGVIDDSCPRDPAFVYGATKVLCEKLAERHHANTGLDITGLRLSRVYGFGEHLKLSRGTAGSWLSPLMWHAAVTSEPVVIPFGRRRLDFHYVEDVGASFAQALSLRGGTGDAYLTHGDLRGVAEAFDFVRQLLPDADLTLRDDDAPLGAGSSISWSREYDASRAERELGIATRFGMEAGLFKTINDNRRFAGLPELAAPPQVDVRPRNG